MDMFVFNANSADPDQTPRSAASDLGQHCLSMSLLWDARHKWVKIRKKKTTQKTKKQQQKKQTNKNNNKKTKQKKKKKKKKTTHWVLEKLLV